LALLRYRFGMGRTLDRDPHSYLGDPSVPGFSAGPVFTVMDARCSLCARGAAWIARHDRAQEFTIIPLQSEVGRALMVHYGLDPADPASWLYVEDGRAFASLDAFVRVGRRLGGVWRGLRILGVLPRVVRDTLYRLVARNRYRLFGTTDLCALPDPGVQKRLLR
jgi:predicted DCC family thiol-disulfide oxidoreductase YuxK